MVEVNADNIGESSLVICNLWRIDRANNGEVRAFEFDLTSALWIEVRKFDYWPEIPLFPVQKTQSLDWWRDVARRAVWKALIAAGYTSLPRHVSDGGSGEDGVAEFRCGA
jgi:hypothetical protein